MKNGVCPECHSTEIYRSGVSPLHAGESLVRIFNPSGTDLPVEIYLCAQCGHVAMFVAESYQAHLAEALQSKMWKRAN